MSPKGTRGASKEEAPVEHLITLGGVLEFLADRVRARRLLLITDSPRVAGEILTEAALPVVLATTKEDLGKDYASSCETVLYLSQSVPQSIKMLENVRGILVSAYLEGSLGDGEDILCLAGSEAQPLLVLNFSVSTDPIFRMLQAGIEERCDLRVFEALLRVAGDLVREGREGKAVGTLFLIGDDEKVLEFSRQVVLNPFSGHDLESRSVLSSDNVETLKEFSQLDGAIVVSGDGHLQAAGRYITLDPDAELAQGLGGRHLAAASVTQKTKAVGIVISTSGIVRVYKDGKPILELDGF